MKRFLLATAILSLIALFMFGCTEPSGPIDPPGSIGVQANSDGLSLTVTWSASPTESSEDGIDGYRVYFNSAEVAELDAGVYSYTFSPSALGTIEVVAYRGEDESSARSVSTALVERQSITLGDWTSTDPSSIGWNRNTGLHTLYRTQSTNAGYIDLIWDSRDNTLNSPNQAAYFGATGHQTGISDPTTASIAPDDFYNFQEIVVGERYVLKLITDGTYYVEFTVESGSAGDITISYGFQKIRGYKRLQ